MTYYQQAKLNNTNPPPYRKNILPSASAFQEQQLCHSRYPASSIQIPLNHMLQQKLCLSLLISFLKSKSASSLFLHLRAIIISFQQSKLLSRQPSNGSFDSSQFFITLLFRASSENPSENFFFIAVTSLLLLPNISSGSIASCISL